MLALIMICLCFIISRCCLSFWLPEFLMPPSGWEIAAWLPGQDAVAGSHIKTPAWCLPLTSPPPFKFQSALLFVCEFLGWMKLAILKN